MYNMKRFAFALLASFIRIVENSINMPLNIECNIGNCLFYINIFGVKIKMIGSFMRYCLNLGNLLRI